LTFTDAGQDHKRFGAAVEKKNEGHEGFNRVCSMTVRVNMGRSRSGRQRPPDRAVVAFDFDGTLTFRDSFLAFLAWRSGPLGYCLGLVLLAPAALVYLVGGRDRGRLKAAAGRVFLRGLSHEALARACAEFAQSSAGQSLIRPDAEQCWAEWRAKGAIMVIVTASPEDVVRPFAKSLGGEVLIGTQLQFDAAGRATGALEGENCRGEEKARRLRARFGPELRLRAAYGDTSGDREMLAMAETRGYRVFTARRRKASASAGAR
jgi:phosphatidylglycerophosphatase C